MTPEETKPLSKMQLIPADGDYHRNQESSRQASSNGQEKHGARRVGRRLLAGSE